MNNPIPSSKSLSPLQLKLKAKLEELNRAKIQQAAQTHASLSTLAATQDSDQPSQTIQVELPKTDDRIFATDQY